ncbi:MAG: hypothetical protein OEZ32_08890 [Nitrospinota bacterium]|nr:hypothetical protein [Nitrospinota bacterium]
MNFQPKEIAIYAVVGLTMAVVVNNVADLNIPFLNSIERSILPDSSRGLKGEKGRYDYSNTEDSAFEIKADCKRLKTSGDRKIMIREKIKEAKRAKDSYLVEEWEARLREVEDEVRQACD